MVFLPMAQAPHKADAKELIYSLPIHEFTSFFSTKIIFVGMLKQTFPRKQAFVDRKQGPSFSHVATLQFVSSAETDSAYSGRQTASFVSDRTELSSFATHGDEYN